ncbi:MAG: hypothetical protein ABEH43_03175 [Flavobacteriales bacterium]
MNNCIKTYLSFIIFLCLTTNILSQNENVQKELDDVNDQTQYVLKTNPFRVLWGELPFTAEYRLNAEAITGRFQSSELGLSYFGPSPLLKVIEDSINARANGQFSISFQVSGFRLQFSHRFYFTYLFTTDSKNKETRTAPKGYYIDPHISASRATFKVNHQDDASLTMKHLTAEILIGRQWRPYNNLFLMDLFIGVGYKDNTWDLFEFGQLSNRINDDDMGIYGGNLKLTLGVNFGLEL